MDSYKIMDVRELKPNKIKHLAQLTVDRHKSAYFAEKCPYLLEKSGISDP